MTSSPLTSRGRSIESVAPASAQRLVEALAVAIRVVRLEHIRCQVAVERPPEAFDQVRRGRRDQPDVPFQAINQRPAGEIRRADVGSVEPRVPAEEPGLRVQSRGLSLVGDGHFRLGFTDQPIQGRALSRARVRRREHPDRHPACGGSPQGLRQHSYSRPTDERHDDVDAVSARYLRRQFGDQTPLVASSCQQGDLAQRGLRVGERPRRLVGHRDQELDRHRNTLIASGDLQQAVGQVSPIGLVIVRLENSRKLGRDKLGECPCVLLPARTRIQELRQPRLDRRPDGAPLRITQLTTIQGRRSEQVVDARGQMLHARQATGGQVPSRRSTR